MAANIEQSVFLLANGARGDMRSAVGNCTTAKDKHVREKLLSSRKKVQRYLNI